MKTNVNSDPREYEIRIWYSAKKVTNASSLNREMTMHLALHPSL